MQNSNPSSLAPDVVPLTPELTASPAKGVDEQGEGGACDAEQPSERAKRRRGRRKQELSRSVMRAGDMMQKKRLAEQARNRESQVHSRLGQRGLTTLTREVGTADPAGAVQGASKR